jgi:hypothetical protein
MRPGREVLPEAVRERAVEMMLAVVVIAPRQRVSSWPQVRKKGSRWARRVSNKEPLAGRSASMTDE